MGLACFESCSGSSEWMSFSLLHSLKPVVTSGPVVGWAHSCQEYCGREALWTLSNAVLVGLKPPSTAFLGHCGCRFSIIQGAENLYILEAPWYFSHRHNKTTLYISETWSVTLSAVILVIFMLNIHCSELYFLLITC